MTADTIAAVTADADEDLLFRMVDAQVERLQLFSHTSATAHGGGTVGGGEPNVSRLLECVELLSRIPASKITLKLLSETGVGRAIGKLRRLEPREGEEEAFAALALRARTTIDTWKAAIDWSAQTASPAAAQATAARAMAAPQRTVGRGAAGNTIPSPVSAAAPAGAAAAHASAKPVTAARSAATPSAAMDEAATAPLATSSHREQRSRKRARPVAMSSMVVDISEDSE